ncbi:uncharacterized protein DSM5745_00472 [Aspergillus mulundensis]|uniref:Uncharacterized protein n=1 Tax=Aspergillus mulundensis TaxID=1810919 RepID=A0A3D8T3N8_9EURO|nr:Uncharacterized protein DSM5745_00472 [Aspergillus mulundensis]RDW93150.1 Uncharacterized protein DSM5745_00472 [Aspergillus mulundensis]
MVTTASESICAALDDGGGVRFGPQTFAIYSCAALPPSFGKVRHDPTLHAKLSKTAARVCKTLPVYIDLQDEDVAELASLHVPVSVPRGQRMLPIKANMIDLDHLPWFLINAAVSKKHCVIGRGSAVESLLVILQRPWCVLEVCCADTETIAAMKDFALLATLVDGESYNAALLLLSHEYLVRLASISRSADILLPCNENSSARPFPEKAIRDIYAATTLVSSYNRFWLPLVCCCAVYLDLSFPDAVRRIRDDAEGLDGMGWIELYRFLLRRVGDWA